MSEEEYQVCYKHPDRKTLLRCNKCNRPICSECAVQTPTGYRCKDCIREQQKVFNTSEGKDYVIGGVIAAVLALAGSFADMMIPLMSWLTALIIGAVFGRLICSAVRAAVQRRRSDMLTRVVIIAAAVGGLIPRLQEIIININVMEFGIPGLFMNGVLQILLDLLYVVVLCVTISMDMNGMIFRR